MRTRDLDERFPAGPEAPGLARRMVDALADEVAASTLEDLRLLVSELVTNSIRHAGMPDGAEVLLSIHVSSARARVEVTDSGGGFDLPSPPSPQADSGWGLYLVDSIASRWGRTRGRAATVWFELDL